MFGQSRIKQLEQQLEDEKEINKATLNRIDNLSKLIELINNKIDPQPTPTYNVDVINYVNKLKGFTKKKICGVQGCQYCYIIPSWIIDSLEKRNKCPKN